MPGSGLFSVPPRVDRADGAGFFIDLMRILVWLIILGPLLIVALRGDWVATGIVTAIYFMVGCYGMVRLDNGEKGWRKYWEH